MANTSADADSSRWQVRRRRMRRSGASAAGGWIAATRTGVLVAALAAGVIGCGGAERDALRKRVSALQEQVTLLENSQDRLDERLAAMEMSQMETAQRAAPASVSAPQTLERPRLKVIKVGPGSPAKSPPVEAPPPAASETEDEDSDRPRPLIRGTGTDVERHLSPRSTSHLGTPSVAAPSISAPPAPAVAPSGLTRQPGV